MRYRVDVVESDAHIATREFDDRDAAIAYADDAASEADDAPPCAHVFNDDGMLVHIGTHYAAALRLRPALAADEERAWEIQRDAFDEIVTRTWGGWTDEQVHKARAEWRAAQTRIIEVAGRACGIVRLERHDAHDWLDLIAVEPGSQNRGIGGRVMRLLMDDAAVRGVPLWLSVYRTNPARALYARLGFAEHARDDLRVAMVHPPDAGEVPPCSPGAVPTSAT